MLATLEKSSSRPLRHKRCPTESVNIISRHIRYNSTLVRTRAGEKHDDFEIWEMQDRLIVSDAHKAQPYYSLWPSLLIGSIQIHLVHPRRNWQKKRSTQKPLFSPLKVRHHCPSSRLHWCSFSLVTRSLGFFKLPVPGENKRDALFSA